MASASAHAGKTDPGLAAGKARPSPGAEPPERLRYQPFYCEENVWWLCAEPPPGVSIAQVIFVASRYGVCPIAEQRAGGADGLAWWDYHCVGLDQQRRIWDLDSWLPLPVAARVWLERSFPRSAELPAPLEPWFRLVPAADFLRAFRSDRRHMRRANGGWLKPPPPWPCIGAGGALVGPAINRSAGGVSHGAGSGVGAAGASASNLAAFCNPSAGSGPGQVLDRDGFAAWIEAAAPD